MAFGLATLVQPLNVAAQEEPVTARLEWEPPPPGSGCIEASELRKAIERRLGRPIFDQEQADVVVHGGIARQESGFSVLLQLSSSHGEPMGRRELESPGEDCSSLDDSLALVLAVMLDIPKTRVPPPAPKPDSTAADAKAPQPRPAQELGTKLRLPKDVAPKRPAWHFDAAAHGSAKFGLVPEPALGITLRVSVRPPQFWRMALELGWYASAEENTGVAGARFSPLEVGILICPLEFEALRLRFEGCLAQHFGRLKVEGFGFDENQSVTRSFVNVGAAFGVKAALSGPVFARVALGAATPVVRETFRYAASSGDRPSLFRMAPLVAQGQIGLGAEF